MGDISIALWTVLTDWFATFYNGRVFFVIKIILAIYSAVLIVDVILLVYLGNVRRQLRTMRKGAGSVKTAKRADQKIWSEILGRLDSDVPQHYQAAILEGDQFVYKALDVQGYSGGNFSERLAQIPPGSFRSMDAVRDVHTLSNRIVQEPQITVTKEQAQNALGVYEKFLKSIDYL